MSLKIIIIKQAQVPFQPFPGPASRTDGRVERMDAVGDPGVPSDGGQQGPPNLHDGQGPGLLISLSYWLRTFLLFLENRRYGVG